MDPATMSMFAGSALKAGASVATPAGPSNAIGGVADGKAYVTSPIDNSNWTIAMGSSKASSTSIPWGVVVAAAVVVAFILWKKK